MSTKPVVVYGASGYTGRLVCEYLREYNVPFTAAGRDKDLIQQVLDKIPGIETVDHDIAEVDHDVASLTDLFRGAQVVSNIVGPFIKYGPEVVEASLAAGCHYLDTTGEQDWVMHAKSQWGKAFADKGLLLAPSIAQMYTTGEIAANLCLETPGLDTLDILVLWKGFPTYASMQTIFTILKADHYYLEQNQYKQWEPTTTFEVSIPGQHSTGMALPWGGTSHPVWFKDDPRVANVKVAGGVFDRTVMEGVIATVKMVEEQIKTLPADEQEAALGEVAGFGAGQHAAARKPKAQHIFGLGLCVRAARPGALRDPRESELQAIRAAAGLRGVLPVAAAAQAGRLRLRLPGLRSSRTARCAAQLRPRHGARTHRAPLSRSPNGGSGMRLSDYLDKGASLGPCGRA